MCRGCLGLSGGAAAAADGDQSPRLPAPRLPSRPRRRAERLSAMCYSQSSSAAAASRLIDIVAKRYLLEPDTVKPKGVVLILPLCSVLDFGTSVLLQVLNFLFGI